MAEIFVNKLSNRLQISTTIKPISKSTLVKDDKELEYRVTSGLIYNIDVVRISSAITSTPSVRPGSEVGWAAFDDQEEAGPFFAAQISRNEKPFDDEEQTRKDTYNFLILKHSGDGSYRRVGVGEVVAEDWFFGHDKVRIEIT
jgi:hypothetical protein